MGVCPCHQKEPDIEVRAVRELACSVARAWPSRGGPPAEEIAEVQALKPCQAQAVLRVRSQCARASRRSFPHLVDRAAILGFSAQDVEDTLSYIREEAPLIVHVDLEKYGSSLAVDSHYRNMFEVVANGASIHANSREEWEARLFGPAYSKACPFDRCKYGVLNVTNDPQGVRCCSPMYGSSYLLLKGVRCRTTFSAEDSAELDASELATVDCYAHVLARYTDLELRATLEVGTKRRPGVTSLAIQVYKEAQIHGEVRLKDHVELVMAHPSLPEKDREMLERLAKTCACPLVMIDVAQDGDGVADELYQEVFGTYDEQDQILGAVEEQMLAEALEASRQDAGRSGVSCD